MTASKEEVVDELSGLAELLERRVQLAEYQRSVYQVTVEPGVERKHLTNERFWKHVARKLRPYDRLEVVTDDGDYFCELIVLSSAGNWAVVKEMRYIELSSDVGFPGSESNPEYTVAWRGPILKHVIVRVADNEVIKKEIPTKAAAHLALTEYLQVINR